MLKSKVVINELPEYCIKKIIEMHSDVMQQFGYMDKNGNLL
jgi:hypothetical protein